MFIHQIGVIGSAKIADDSSNYILAEELGKMLIDEGYRILCGGLEGIMEGVCKGAKKSSLYKEGLTVGIVPSLNPYSVNKYVDIRIATGFSIGRNQVIIASSDAIISIGGGSGTLSEIAFSWQMKKPIISIKTTGGWSQKLAGTSIDEERADQIHAVSNIKEARELLKILL